MTNLLVISRVLAHITTMGGPTSTYADSKAAPIPTVNGYEQLNEAVDALIPGIRALYLTGIHSYPFNGKTE